MRVMRRAISVALVSAFAAIAAPAAQAQLTYEPSKYWDSRWYLTPFASYVWADGNRQSDNGWGGGLAIGKPMSPNWNLELRTMYESLGSQSGGPGDYKNWSASLDAQYFFLGREGYAKWRSIQPYAVAGIGAIRDDANGTSTATTKAGTATSFMWNAGLGFVWPFSDWGRLVVDGRYRWDDNHSNLGRGGNFGDWIVSAGLQIPLGAAPRVAEPMRAAPPAPAPVAQPAPAPVVVPPPPPPAPKPVTRTFDLSADALFDFGSATLTNVGRARVDEIVRVVRETGFTATSIALLGHTDPIGSEAYNQVLSERRANAVRDYLVSQGISPSIITATGKGKSQLRITEADCKAKGQAKTRAALIACLAPDRRVEAVITGTQAPR
jgi:OOP family OmpA-OmpF porin